MGLQYAQTASVQPPPMPALAVRTAVILAAGNGNRLQVAEKIVPKPLMKVGGLHLIERALLSLAAAGIQHFRIVIGAHGAAIRKTIQGLRSLRGLQIEFVECPNYEQGNGISLAAGAGTVEEPFLVAMADHIIAPETIREFITATAQTPDLPLLATDPNPATVFDLADATKVSTAGHRITAIGKDLTDFQQIDIGLFYFPAGTGAQLAHHAAHGAQSVSALVQRINHADGFFTVPLRNPFWQDIDTPAMAKEAEQRLLRALRKPTDGLVSRYCNRAISTRISKWLAPWRISPNAITTFVFLLSLVAAGCVASPQYRWIALGGLLFQLASILDGCDGELSRLTLRGSKFGAWYDTITDNVRYILFFVCMGISAYRMSHHPAYLWGLMVFALLGIFFSIKMGQYTAHLKQGTNLATTAIIEAYGRQSKSRWDRFALSQRFLIKQDVSAAIAMVCALAGQPGILLWVCCYAMILMAITVVRALPAAPEAETGVRETKGTSVLFLLGGVALLGFLLSRMPINDLWTSLATIGGRLWIVLAVAPFWFIFNAISLSVLIGKRVNFLDVYYNQLVGEAINTIVPLAGLAGEPYKAKHLSQWIPLSDASRAIVHNKIIHAISGPLFSGLCCLVTVVAVPLAQPLAMSITLAAVGMLTVAGVLLMVALSKAPDRLTTFVLTRLKFLGTYEQQRLEPRLLLVSLIHKMIGRTINLLEVVTILYLLGLPFTVGDVVAIEAFVTATAVLFVVVPQGIGVNEMGIAGAFALLGLPAPLALSFGIIRRARVIFWAIAGLVLHVMVSLIQHVSRTATAPVRRSN